MRDARRLWLIPDGWPARWKPSTQWPARRDHPRAQPRCRWKPSNISSTRPCQGHRPRRHHLLRRLARQCCGAAAAHGLRFSPLAAATRRRIESWVAVARSSAIRSMPALPRSPARMLFELHRNSVGRSGIDALLLQEELPRGSGTERKSESEGGQRHRGARRQTDRLRHHDLPRCLPITAKLTALSCRIIASCRRSTNPWPRCVSVHRACRNCAGKKSRPSLRCKNQNRTGRKFVRAEGALNEVESRRCWKTYGIPHRKNPSRAAKRKPRRWQRNRLPVVAKAVSAALAIRPSGSRCNARSQIRKDVRAAYKRIMAAGKRATVALRRRADRRANTGRHRACGSRSSRSRNGTRDPVRRRRRRIELHPMSLVAPPLMSVRRLPWIARTRCQDHRRLSRQQKAGQQALVKALIALSQLAMDAGARLQSVDVNPFR